MRHSNRNGTESRREPGLGFPHFIAALSAAAVFLLPAQALPMQDTGESWTMWRKNASRQAAVTTLRGNLSTPVVRWRVRAESLAEGSAAIADVNGDGELDVVITSYGGCFALRRLTGERIWGYPSSGTYNMSSPAVADLDRDGTLEVIFGENLPVGRITCLNARTGQIKWYVLTNQNVWASPAVADVDGDGRLEVICPSTNNNLYCIRADGSPLWQVGIGNSYLASAAVGDIDGDGALDVVCPGGFGELRAFDARTGAQKWRRSVPGQADSTPLIADVDRDGAADVVMTLDGYGILCVRGDNGQDKWTARFRTTARMGIISSCAVADLDGDGNIDVVSGSADDVYCVDGRDGRIKWQYSNGGNPGADGNESSPAIGDVDGDGRLDVVIGDHLGYVRCINGQTGAIKWSFFALEGGGELKVVSSPTLADLDGDGSLEIIFGSNWPQWVCLGAPGTPPPPPTVRITAPTNGSTVTGSVAIRAEASGGTGGIARVEFTVDGASVGTDTTAPYEAVWTATPGSHTIRAVATDGAGRTASDTITVTGSGTTNPLTVRITSPVNNSTVSGSVAIRADASGGSGGVARVEFSVDGALVGADTAAPYEATWNAAPGTHTIRALATDGAGNTASDSVTVNVENNTSRGGLVGPWPVWRRDLRNSGFEPRRGNMNPPRLEWAESIRGNGESTPTIGDVNGDGVLDVVCFTYSGYMTVRNARTGALVWERGLTTSGTLLGSPTIADLEGDGSVEILIGFGTTNRLVCLRGTDGQTRWEFAASRPIYSTPLVADVDGDGRQDVILAVSNNALYILDTNGAQVWRSSFSPSTYGSPAIGDVNGDGVLDIVQGTSSGVTCVRGDTRATLWSSPYLGDVISTPVITDLENDGRMEIVVNRPNGVSVLDGTDGQRRAFWATNGTSVGWMTSAAVGDLTGDGVLDVVAGSGTPGYTIYAFNGTNGEVLWSFNAGDAVEPSPVICDTDNDGRLEVIYRDYTNTLRIFDGRTGRVEWETRFTGTVGNGASSPIVADVDGDGFVEMFIQETNGLIHKYVGQAAPVDNPPTVQITAPANGTTVSGTVTVSANASDDRPGMTVTFFANGNPIGQATGPYTVQWNTTGVANGSYTLVAEARDSAGQTARDQVTVTVSNQTADNPPTLQVIGARESETVRGVVILVADARDDRGISRVEFFVDDALLVSAASPPYEARWDTRTAADGDHRLRVVATDTAGQTASWAVTVRVSNSVAPDPDRPPTLQVIGAREGETVRGVVILVADARDDRGISRVEFFVDDALLVSAASPPYEARWDTRTAADGDHRLRVVATDTAGQTASWAATVRVSNAALETRSATFTAIDSGHAYELDGQFYRDRETIWSGRYGDPTLFAMVLFDTSNLPSGATVTEMQVELTGAATTGSLGPDLEWRVQLMPQAIADSFATLNYARISSAASQGTFSPAFRTADLGTSVVNTARLQGPATAGGRIAIRIDGPTARNSVYRWYGAIAASGQRPRLTVRYTEGSPPRNEAPAVRIDAPGNGATVQGTVTVSASASDPDGEIARVDFLVDGTAVASDTAQPFGFDWDTRTVSNGSHRLTAVAYANDGGSAEDSIQVTVSNNALVDLPPTVGIDAPSNDATVSGTVQIRATASDDRGVAEVRFFVDGNLLAADAASPYETAWNTAAVANGDHTIAAEAVDTAGQTARAQIRVRVANGTQDNPPTVRIDSPAEGATVSGIVTIRVTASDDVRVDTVEFYVDQTYLGEDRQASQFAWDTRTASNGARRIRAVARDSAGQTASASVNVTVNNAPVQTQNTVVEARDAGHAWESDGSFYTGRAEFRSGTDGQGRMLTGMILFDLGALPPGAAVTRLELEITGSSGGFGIPTGTQWTVDLLDAASATNWSSLNYATVQSASSVGRFSPIIGRNDIGARRVNRLSLDVSLTAGGRVALRVNGPRTTGFSYFSWYGAAATDATLRPRLRVFFQDSAPSVQITEPNNGQAVFLGPIAVGGKQVRIVAEAKDSSGIAQVDFYVGGGKIASVPGQGPYECVWDTSRLPTCRRTIRAVATNVRGRQASHQIEVVVDREAPRMYVQTPTGDVVAGPVKVRVSARDNHRVEEVSISIDDQVVERTCSCDFDGEIDTRQLSNGEHVVTIVARDSVGNKTESRTRFRVYNATEEDQERLRRAAAGGGIPRGHSGGGGGAGGGIVIRIRIRMK